MKNKILTIFILGIFLFSFANVFALDSLGTFKQGETIRISQVCNDASYITISSIAYPNSTHAIANTNMTFSGSGEYHYNFTSADALGRYDVRGISDGCENTYATYFEVTPSGKTSSTGESILYFLFTIIIFLLLGTMIYFIIMIDPRNLKDDNSQTFGVNKLKHVKILLIGFTYPVLLILLNLMNGLAVNFTSLSIFSGTIGFLFEMLLRLAWPWTIVIMAWLVVKTIQDSNFKRLMTEEGYNFVR